jgi:hypothetical protein
MRIPNFTAEQGLPHSPGYVRRAGRSRAGSVVPAIPFCGNCDEILDRCAVNGFRPRAVCYACLTGDCYSGVEKPPILLQDRPPRLGPLF